MRTVSVAGLRGLAMLCALAILGAAGAGTTASLAATKTERTFSGWTVICVEDDNSAKRCSMIQSRVRAQDRRTVLIWAVSANENNELTQTVTVPVGVSIKEGLRLFVGNSDPLTIGYDVCGPRICLGSVPFTPEFVATIKSSDKASASYVQANKQLMQVDLDLAGFGEAYDYLVEQLSS